MRHFTIELEEVNQKLLQMGGLVESAIHRSVHALLDRSGEIAEEVIRATVGFKQVPWIRDFGLPVSIAVLLEYLTLTFNFAGDWLYVNNVYWSLPVEFQFYVMLPLFVLVLRRSGAVALIALALLLYIISGYTSAQFITLQLAWQFIGGVLAGWLFERRLKPLSQWLVWCGIALAVAIAFGTHKWMWGMHFVPWMDNYFTMGSLALTYGLAAILLVFFAANLDGERFAVRRWWRLAVVQGTISYSIYLCHNLALLLGYVVIVSVGLTGWSRLAFVYAVCVPLAYVLAWYSYSWVERPGIEFGRTLRLPPSREVTPRTARPILLPDPSDLSKR